MRTIIALTTLVATVSAFSQGTVNFRNIGSQMPADGIDRKVYDTLVGGTALLGTNFLAQLYFAAGSGANADSLAPVPTKKPFFPSNITLNAGFVNGQTLAGVLTGGGVGITVTLEVRAWDYGVGQFLT